MRVQFSPCGIRLGHMGRCVPIAKRTCDETRRIILIIRKVNEKDLLSVCNVLDNINCLVQTLELVRVLTHPLYIAFVKLFSLFDFLNG